MLGRRGMFGDAFGERPRSTPSLFKNRTSPNVETASHIPIMVDPWKTTPLLRLAATSMGEDWGERKNANVAPRSASSTLERSKLRGRKQKGPPKRNENTTFFQSCMRNGGVANMTSRGLLYYPEINGDLAEKIVAVQETISEDGL